MIKPRQKMLSRICVVALFSALICILSPLAIPIGPIPISLSLVAVFLSVMLLGVWGSLSAVAVYLMLGAMGLPVFSGGMAGLGVLLGPTGGYIWSYLPICLLCGWLYRTLFFSRPNKERGFFKLFWGIVCGLPGLLLCYLLGTLQYMLVASISFWSALAVCVIPFVGFDLIKLALVAFLGEKMLRIRWIRRMLGDCFG
jgi:biotin transport system substrate-specific component